MLVRVTPGVRRIKGKAASLAFESLCRTGATAHVVVVATAVDTLAALRARDGGFPSSRLAAIAIALLVFLLVLLSWV